MIHIQRCLQGFYGGFALSLFLVFCGIETNAQELSCQIGADDVQPHLNYLASPDRQGRDDWGKVEAREYIIKHFKSLGVKPLFDESYLQAIPEFGSQAEMPPVYGYNIGGFIEGTDPKLKHEWIIVNAHYDHLGVRGGKVFPGADDNASGVSMLLEVARHISRSPGKRSVAFLSFDMEEHLLWGSRWFLAHPPMEVESIKFCLTADMIGRSLGGLDIPTVFVLGSERSREVHAALEAATVPQGLEIAQLGVDVIGVRSDYGPFYYRRIPFLFFSTGEHPDYHTPQDTLERLDVEKVARVSTVMNQVAQSMANTPGEITWEGTPEPSLQEVESVNRVCVNLLNAGGSGSLELTNAQQFFVSQVKSKTDYILKSKKYSNEERKWLVRATQIMMLTIF
ncbi:M28 family metallopeptidase [Thalassoglobus sp.]|uniref:M28 family metallopeptidase n=1 Tax=Thalassoglobus sp. TaxID=2795869 RepID=UPI003AA98892